MTKPIEWTREVKSTETTLIRTRLAVQQMDRYGSTIAVLAATTADIVAALAAMGEGERAEVLRELDAGPRTAPSWLSDAAEALGEVRPEDGAPLALNWTQVVRAIYDQRAERDNWRARAEKAERERSEAVALHKELADSLRSIHRSAIHERTVVAEEFDSLRTRLIAAESAAAAREPETRGCSYTDAVTLFRRDPSASWTCDELQKNHGPDARCRFYQEEARMTFPSPGGFYSGPYTPTRAEALATDWRRVEAKPAAPKPREYPLAEGSRWIDNVIRNADGSQSWLSDGQVVTDGPLTGGLRYTYRQSARNLAALLAKGGLL